MIKYKLEYKTENETIRKALELVIADSYNTMKEVLQLRRHIKGLFPDVLVRLISVSKLTRVHELKL